MHRSVRLVALAVFCALPLAACGDDDSPFDGMDAPPVTGGIPDDTDVTIGGSIPTEASGDAPGAPTAPASDEARDEFVDGLAATLEVEDPEQARCVAGALVDGIGMEQITASGVRPEDMVALGSLDDVGLSMDDDAISSATDDLAACGGIVELFLGNGPAAECAAPLLTEELAAAYMVGQLSGVEPSPEVREQVESALSCHVD